MISALLPNSRHRVPLIGETPTAMSPRPSNLHTERRIGFERQLRVRRALSHNHPGARPRGPGAKESGLADRRRAIKAALAKSGRRGVRKIAAVRCRSRHGTEDQAALWREKPSPHETVDSQSRAMSVCTFAHSVGSGLSPRCATSRSHLSGMVAACRGIFPCLGRDGLRTRGLALSLALADRYFEGLHTRFTGNRDLVRCAAGCRVNHDLFNLAPQPIL
jgi:hypothetical protein